MSFAEDYALRAEAAFNAREERALLALWNEQFLYSSLDEETRTAEDALKRERALWESSSDIRATLRAFCSEGEKLVVEATMSGTHDGPLKASGREIPPTGRRFRVDFVALFTFRDGKVAAERVHYDRLSLLEQLGLV